MRKILLIASLIFLSSIFVNSQTKVAIIKSCSGDIKVIQGKEEIKAKNYLEIIAPSTIVMEKDSYLTLFFKNGDTVTFSGINKFEISTSGLKALMKETEVYLAEVKKTYTAKDTLSSRKGKKEEIPESVTKEIQEIEENVSDPVLKALLKGECYKRNNLPVKASEEFRIHKKLIGEEKN